MRTDQSIINRYTVTAGVLSYSVTFPLYERSDVAVYLGRPDGSERLLVLDADYSVSINDNQTGGTVVLFDNVAEVGDVLALLSAVSYTQELDLSNVATIDVNATERQMDRTTQQIQQLKEQVERSVKINPTSSGSWEELVRDLFNARAEAVTAAGDAQAAEAGARQAEQDVKAWPGRAEVLSTGATTPRTLQDRFADVVNVKDFGAKGDGVTDDTAAIRAAIRAASQIRYPAGNTATMFAGTTVFFPYGVYNVSEMITVEWFDRASIIMDGAVLRATAEMEAVLYFKNCWMHGGNSLKNCCIDMRHIASRGLWIDAANEGFLSDGLVVKNIGNGTGVELGNPDTPRSGARHFFNNTLITDYQTGKNDGGSNIYQYGIGMRVRVADCYFVNTVVYCCNRGIVVEAGGNNFVNCHIWHDMLPDHDWWDNCYGVYATGTRNNFFDGLYCDNYARGISASIDLYIGAYFYYLPYTPSAKKECFVISTTANAFIKVETLYPTSSAHYNLHICYEADRATGSWMYRSHAKNKKINHNLPSTAGFQPIDPAFNITNYTFSRSPANVRGAGLSGIYLLGYVRPLPGSGTLHIAIPEKLRADVLIRRSSSGAFGLEMSNVWASADTISAQSKIIIGTETVNDGLLDCYPVYLYVSPALTGSHIELYHTSTGGQDFFLHKRDKYTDLIVPSVTELVSKTFA